MTEQKSEPSKIQIMIAEDQQLIRRAFVHILSLDPEIEVVAEASNGEEAIMKARAWRPAVILMDIQMPRTDGIKATRAIKKDFPDTKIIMLTTFDTDELVFEAISAGASGYLLKDVREDALVAAIKMAVRGEAPLAPGVARLLMEEFRRMRPGDAGKTVAADQLEPLTAREQEILHEISAGQSNKEIAKKLALTEGTVKNYVSSILDKYHAKSRTELALMAARQPPR